MEAAGMLTAKDAVVHGNWVDVLPDLGTPTAQLAVRRRRPRRQARGNELCTVQLGHSKDT
jgi:hypothetical protein